MGSGGIIVLDEDTCIVDLAKYFLTFTTAESCGKCTPCREGTKRLLDILTKITDGRGELIDLERLTNLSEVIAESSLCALGRIAPNPILTTLQHFQEEYKAHILERRCPAHVCSKFIDYKVIPELCTGCGLCVKDCPYKAITLDLKSPKDSIIETKADIDQEKCVKCGHCFAICPFRSIKRL